MKLFFKKISYNHRIALVILIFTLLPCTLLEVSYLKNSLPDWKETALNKYQNHVDSTAVSLSKTFTELESKMNYIFNNSSVRTSMAHINHISLVQALDLIIELDKTAEAITADSPKMTVRWYPYESVTAYGSYCYTLEQFTEDFSKDDYMLYQDILALQKGQYLWAVRDIVRGQHQSNNSENRLCMYTQLSTINTPNCILEFTIPISDILEHQNFDVPDSFLSIRLNKNTEPLYIMSDSASNDQIANNLEDYLATDNPFYEQDILRSSIPNTHGGEVLYILPSSYAQEIIRPQLFLFTGISIVTIVTIIAASYLTSYLLTRKLLHTISDINDDLDHILKEPNLSNYTGNDIDLISFRVRKLIKDTSEYSARLKHFEAENLRMELELLQMRFNPHLLYNSLGAIRHQAKSPAVRETIDALCNYYRIILNNGYLIIRIKDEIEMVKNYLFIQKFAYRLDDIQYMFEIDEQINQYAIIKHLLQPIVENALNHGLRPAGRSGILHILAVLENEQITIKITDNGIGMSAEKIDRLLQAPVSYSQTGGYGIYNVQQRIHVYYGTEYGLRIKSEIGKGTTVTLTIPAVPIIQDEALTIP